MGDGKECFPLSCLLVFLFVCLFVFGHGVACRILGSPTRDRTLAPCVGSVESLPLDCQGSPSCLFMM